MMKIKSPARANSILISSVALLSFSTFAHCEPASTQTSTQLSFEPSDASKASGQVASTVVRVSCTNKPGGGTGFVHKSGWVVTAAHVARYCGDPIVVSTPAGQNLSVKKIRRNDLLDLALLSAEPRPDTKGALPLTANSSFPIGARVSTWGFPGGYSGSMPLLSVGYLAGVQQVKNDFGLPPPSWVVNGAFNGGNSGGPLISIQDGSVIGVVSSKLAPLPRDLEISLKDLSSNNNGTKYKRQRIDGTVTELTDGQLIAEVLYYLRNQMQLVVGYAVGVKELSQFLKENGIDP
jgi:S1-C subfamily serine protease